MKKFITISLVALAAFTLASCVKEDHASNQKITYYPILELQGGETTFWEKGKAWVDPGFTATLAGVDASSQVTVKGDVDVNKLGPNSISYSLVNEDGFSSSAYRTVFVYDGSAKSDAQGTYVVDLDKSLNGGKNTFKSKIGSSANYAAYATGDYTLEVIGVAPGLFWFEDLLGGWYHYIQGRGGYYNAKYGLPEYFDMTGFVYIDNDGKMTLADSYIECWGDGLDSLTEGKYDAATKTISYKTSYADAAVLTDVVMTKK